MKKIVLIGLILINICFNVYAEDKPNVEKRIGVVNVSEVLNKYKKRADKEKDWKVDEDRITEKMKQKNSEIEALKQEYNNADDDLDRERISIELLKANKDLKFYGELNSERMQKEIGKATLEMIRDIRKTIQDYGEEKKYFLILQSRPINTKTNNLQEAILMINLSDVMYYNKDYDITEEIIKLINIRYELSKKAATPSK